jgi:hypothetical protein
LRELGARVITRWDIEHQDLIVAASDFATDVIRKNRILHVLTDSGRIDILAAAPGAERGFDELAPDARELERAGVRVIVAGVPDLVRMKQATGRPKDLVDLKALRRTQSPPGKGRRL